MSDPRPPATPGASEALPEELGPAFLLRLAAMLRTGRTYDVSNQAFQRQLRDFLEMLRSAIEQESQDELVLVAVADYFYLNGHRIKAQPSLLSVYHWLMGEFERRALGGIRFRHGVHEAELELFFQLSSRPRTRASRSTCPRRARGEHRETSFPSRPSSSTRTR